MSSIKATGYILVCILLFVVAAVVCRPVNSSDIVITPVFAGGRPLNFGVFPFRERTALLVALKPLTDYMSRCLAAPIHVRLVFDYYELESLIRRGDLDLAWCAPRFGGSDFIGSTTEHNASSRKLDSVSPSASPPPYPWNTADSRMSATARPLSPVCRPESSDPNGYHGLILVRADSGIFSLAELKDHIFAYVDRNSNSGFIQPNILMHEAGINPLQHFRQIRFAGNYDSAIEKLLSGNLDAAAVSDIVLHKTHGLDARLRVIATTAAILPDPILVATDISPDFAASVATILIEAASTTEGAAMLASLSASLGIHRFVPLRPETGGK
ncbi:MAG: phosphate/phosphite/phosphonate ABC transporter substrate-binding protein [Candidatus Riflebacteria bacterium]|nr:phosphate/phosphite/phosphonate ABC transporter substrate-binding protein [Candidatus Riflebacteria bacterium]